MFLFPHHSLKEKEGERERKKEKNSIDIYLLYK